MRLTLSSILLLVVVAGCFSTSMPESDARQPRKIGNSIIRLADRDYVELHAALAPYAFGGGSRWNVAMSAKNAPSASDLRWSAELGAIEESRKREEYVADVKVHRDRIATYTPWSDESSVIDRLDGRIVQRDQGKKLFDRFAGRAMRLAVQFVDPKAAGQ